MKRSEVRQPGTVAIFMGLVGRGRDWVCPGTSGSGLLPTLLESETAGPSSPGMAHPGCGETDVVRVVKENSSLRVFRT